MHNRPSKIIVCRLVLACDSGSESEAATFYRLQLWLRLQPKRSTPTGLDSDSAALIVCAKGKKLKKYGEENALQIYSDPKPGPLSGRSISNRQLAILKLTASNTRKLVTKHLSVQLTPQTCRRPPEPTSSKCSTEKFQCYFEGRAFRRPYKASNVCIGFDKHIYESHRLGYQKGKNDGTKSRM